MKRFVCFAAAVLLLLAAVPGVFASAALDRTYYRYNDYVGAVSEENEKILNAKAQSRSEELQMDFPVCVFDSLSDDETLAEFSDRFYEHNKFGYGETKDGIFLVLDIKNSVFDIYYYGAAQTLIDDVTAGELVNDFRDDCHNEDMSFYEVFSAYFDRVFAAVETARAREAAAAEETTARDKSDNADGKPYWYPENTEGFTDFHGEDLAPVTDDADVFTDAQEAELAAKIREMNETLSVSYTALTIDRLCGLTPEEYASDFLHFNGYGVGGRYGAVVFLLCLDMTDRCWLTIAINSYEEVFTADVTYEIDELVDSDIRGGNYYDAFLKHADYTRTLFEKYRDLPDWYPAGTDVIDLDRESRVLPGEAALSEPRVVDEAGVFSSAQREELESALSALSREYGRDFLIFTDSSCCTAYSSDYARDFLYYNGYGDGVLLFILSDGEGHSLDVIADGETGGTFDYAALRSRTQVKADSAGLPDAAAYYIRQLGFAVKHGRLPITPFTGGLCAAIGIICGLIVGKLRLDRLRRGMTVKPATGAAEYLVPGSLIVRSKKTDYLYSTVSRTAKPKPSESSSSSSSGGSRGGSSYSGGRSAGGSYSGGGRRF